MKSKDSLLRRLPGYSAKVAAATAAASSAHGSVIFFDNSPAFTLTQPAPVNGQTTFSHHSWDIDGNTVADFQFTGQRTKSGYGDYKRIIAEPLVSGNKWLAAKTFTDHYNTAVIKGLPRGFFIGSHPASGGFQNNENPLFITQSNAPFSNLHTGDQFVGFKFLIGGLTHYGWAYIDIQPDTLTVDEWAYESVAGASIEVPVPEPANASLGLGLLALGAAGVSGYKRRRKLQAQHG